MQRFLEILRFLNRSFGDALGGTSGDSLRIIPEPVWEVTYVLGGMS
jgi:hypothetical protein